MNTLIRLLAVLTILTISSGCAITNSYGPYMGKVVDTETEEPIEGAVVFLRFFNDCFGQVSSFADAVEVLTDANGEFRIPSHRIFTLRPLCGWHTDCYPIVFKPGYGAFSRHAGTSISEWGEEGCLPRKKPVTIKLPKLTTREERKENLYNIPNIDAPSHKFKKLSELEQEERKVVFGK
ncbi:MAG: carboxypeptidase-like regulatory domain-containing protein [Proteobacteria bacterium]|nr:carboxypeptidase-like regulatory domain-containing protein [Pseudomonadota bacterium]